MVDLASTSEVGGSVDLGQTSSLLGATVSVHFEGPHKTVYGNLGVSNYSLHVSNNRYSSSPPFLPNFKGFREKHSKFSFNLPIEPFPVYSGCCEVYVHVHTSVYVREYIKKLENKRIGLSSPLSFIREFS